MTLARNRRLRSLTQVPTVPVEIDRTHPLAASLVRYWILSSPGAPRDLTNAATASPAAASIPVPSVGPIGRDQSFGASANSGWVGGEGPALGGRSQWTVAAWVRTTTVQAGYGASVYCERPPSGDDILKIGQGGSVQGSATAAQTTYRNDGGTLAQIQGTIVIADGAEHCIAAVFDGSSVSQYVDGRSDGSAAWSSNNDFTNSGIVQSFGYDAQDSTASFTGAVAQVLLFGTALTLPELLQLARSPFGMLRPRRIPRRAPSMLLLDARVTQAVAEALAAPAGGARTSQAVVEALLAPFSNPRVSQAVQEVLINSRFALPYGMVSQTVLEALIASTIPVVDPCKGAVPDPYYDILAQVPAGYTITQPVWDALWDAWKKNCFQPLTPAQALAAAESASGAQPVYPTSIPRFDRGEEQWSYRQIGGN